MEFQGFTIPRKKRIVEDVKVPKHTAENDVLPHGAGTVVTANEKQRKEIEDLIMSTLSDRKLRDFLAVENVKVISNNVLEKKFKKLQSTIRRSQSEKVTYAFLLVGFDETHIHELANTGVPVGSSFRGDLGNRMQGVYLYNHPDLVTPSFSFKNVIQRIMCFKVLRGHSIPVGLDSDNLDASLNASSHTAAADFGVQSRLQKFRTNAIFLYEFDDTSRTTKYPANILPFAVVDLVHGKKVHYTKLPPHASFLKFVSQKSELCTVVPKSGLFSGAECSFSSAIETDLMLPPLDIADCMHICDAAYSWTSILDLLPVRQLIEPKHWGRLVTEPEIFMEINNKMRFYMTHTIFQSDHPNFATIVRGIRKKNMGLIGSSNHVTIVLIPNGELSCFLGFPWTENNHLNALLFSSRHSCLGITDLDRSNREYERSSEESLMKDRDNFLTSDQRARNIMAHSFGMMKRYDHAGKKHLGGPLHVRKPPTPIRNMFDVSTSSPKQISHENSPDEDNRDFKFEFISAPVSRKKSNVSTKLTNNGNRGMPLGRVPPNLKKYNIGKRIRWKDQQNQPLVTFKIIEARGDHNEQHDAQSKQLHDMEHDEGKFLRQGCAKPSNKTDAPPPRFHQSPPASSLPSPQSSDDKQNSQSNNAFREAMIGLRKPMPGEKLSLQPFEVPYHKQERPVPKISSGDPSKNPPPKPSSYGHPPPPPPRTHPRPQANGNGASGISTPASLLQKLARSQRAYSPSDACVKLDQRESTECDMEIDSGSDTESDKKKELQEKEEEFHDPHDIDYDMKIGPSIDMDTSNKAKEENGTSEESKPNQEDSSKSGENNKSDEASTKNNDKPKEEPINVLDLVLKQIGVTDLKRIVSDAKKSSEEVSRVSEDIDMRNMILEEKPTPILIPSIPLSPVSRDDITPPASPTPMIQDVDLRTQEQPVHVAFSLKKDVPKSSMVTSVFGEEEEDESEKSSETATSDVSKPASVKKEDKDERSRDIVPCKGTRDKKNEQDRDRDSSRRDKADSQYSRSSDRDRHHRRRESRERTRDRSRERSSDRDRHRRDRHDDRDRRDKRDHDDRRHRHSSSRHERSDSPQKVPPLVQQFLTTEDTLDIPLPAAPPSAAPAPVTAAASTEPVTPSKTVPAPQLVPIGPSPSAAKTAAVLQATNRLHALMRDKHKKSNTLEIPPPVIQDPVFVQTTFSAPFNSNVTPAPQQQWQQPSPQLNFLKSVPPENSILSALGIQPEFLSRLRHVVNNGRANATNTVEPRQECAPAIPVDDVPAPESPPPAASPEPEQMYPQAIPVIGSCLTQSIPLSCQDTDYRIQPMPLMDIAPVQPSTSITEAKPVKKTTAPKKPDFDRSKKDEDKDMIMAWGAALGRKKPKDSSESEEEEGQLSSDDEDVPVESKCQPIPPTNVPNTECNEEKRLSPVGIQESKQSLFSNPPPFTNPPAQTALFMQRQPLMGSAPITMGNGAFSAPPVNGQRFNAYPAPVSLPTQDYGWGHQPVFQRMIVVVPDSLSFKTQMRPEHLNDLLAKMQSVPDVKPLFLHHKFIMQELDKQLEDPGCNQTTKNVAHHYKNIITNYTRIQVAQQMEPHLCDQKAARNHLEILTCLKNTWSTLRLQNPDMKVEMVYMSHVSPAIHLGRNLQELGIRVLRPTVLTAQYPHLS